SDSPVIDCCSPKCNSCALWCQSVALRHHAAYNAQYNIL
ncbi:uncharacterized protein METZ01_LOCUS331787, partial [marine metagenome]